MKLPLASLAAFAAAVAYVATASPDAHVGDEKVAVPVVLLHDEAAVEIEPQLPLTLEQGMRRYGRIVEDASRAHGVDRALVHALIFAESSYDPDAVSAAGASGLMQLMPDTAREHGVSDPLDPAKNVTGGVKHLKTLLARYEGDVELALAAYNAGVGAVARAGNRIPDNPETTAFVPKVIDYHRRVTARSARS